MKKLLIVESPAKAKTIGKYVGDEYKVVASIGHVRDLPKSNKKAIDIPAGFVPYYEITKGKEKVISEIKRLAKNADEIILATDPDREGEAIAWHLAQLITDNRQPTTIIKRVTYQEITKEAIDEALKNPREIDENLRKAQEARRVLDRLVGYDLSGLIWKKVRYGLSAGRVQSPALRIIMEREREIRAFKPQIFYVITAHLRKLAKSSDTSSQSENFPFVCDKEPKEKSEADSIVALARKGEWSVADIKETEVARSPRPPFTTSTLQQAASSRLGLSPSRTMSIAQRLYEAGLITYMRTDSLNLGQSAQSHIAQVVRGKFGNENYSPRAYKTKSKNAQEAHEAIRPTDPSRLNAGANEEQKKLYRLIWQRTIASQMANAKVLRTKISANIHGGGIPDFSLNGSRVLSPGWLLADPSARKEDVEVPKFKAGESLSLDSVDSLEKETTPPLRYSEAGLVKELEKRGIGRPSTYASIIKTLLDRNYVVKDSRSLVPTDTGDVVSTFLENNFTKYISDSFTAEMEDELDEIADGKREYATTLGDFYTPFSKDVKSKEKIEKITNLGDAPDKWKCPLCGSGMIIKLGKNGKFLSCERFPECSGARTIDGEELQGTVDTGELCPECGKGNLVERDGRYGRFIACARYPKCKFIKKSPEEEAKGKTGIACPVCKTGEMAERRGKYGVFYSCTNYPDCKNAIKARPTGSICELCGSLMMEGTKTIPERCSDKLCPNHNPHKLTK